MHWNVEQILWALLVAAHLILLVVLLGRDRISRFPWFTAATVIAAIRLLADHLLHGKLTTIAFDWESYVAMALDAVVGILVLIEVSRQIFSSGRAGRKLNAVGWTAGTLVALGISVLTVWLWGPWPTWAWLHQDPQEVPLLITVVMALKLSLFVSVLTIPVGLLLAISGKRFGSGWKSHAMQIGLGLSTNAIAIVAVQTIEDIIRHNIRQQVQSSSAAQRNQLAQHLGHVFSSLDNARITIWLVVIIWWIVWLWRDEPGSAVPAPIEGSVEPVGELEVGEPIERLRPEFVEGDFVVEDAAMEDDPTQEWRQGHDGE